MSEKKLNKNEIYPMRTGLLGGWFCVHEEMSEDGALDYLWNKIKAGGTILEVPTEDKELFRDRLFGGYVCVKDPDRRHVYFSLGSYAFLGGEQAPMSREDRQGVWQTLRKGNPEEQFIGSNKFTKDCLMIN